MSDVRGIIMIIDPKHPIGNVLAGVPETALLVGVQQDFRTGLIQLKFHDKIYPKVADGQEYPRV